ncbi:MAG TPA: glutathione S-transferase family protein [Gammaproteobacteria bacterium]
MKRLKLLGEPSFGSAIVEAQLDWYGFDYDFEAVGDLFQSEAARQRVGGFNPLAQVPTLVLADGTVMTESAAITLHLADVAGDASLVPAAGEPERPRFLRWLIFLVANVYPTYTYADDPSRFVHREAAAQDFRRAVDDYAKRLYAILEGEASAPWFLGERFSALDLYVCTMTHWRPRPPWFAEHTPKLAAITGAAEKIPKLERAWRRNGFLDSTAA